MRPITFEWFSEQEGKSPGRRCFAHHSSIGPGDGDRDPYFSPPFGGGIKFVFEAETGLYLRQGNRPDNWYCYLKGDSELEKAQQWEVSQGHRVYLRDCLTCSIALGHNFVPDSEPKAFTAIGQLEHDAKQLRDGAAIAELTRLFVEAIGAIAPYAQARVIAAVPGREGKPFDLPTELARRIADARDLTNLTSFFHYDGDKGQLKQARYEDRWSQLEQAGLRLNREAHPYVAGNPVILIDDKYQSGVTANFVGMLLQQHGASDVLGLYAVKTWRDTDNT